MVLASLLDLTSSIVPLQSLLFLLLKQVKSIPAPGPLHLEFLSLKCSSRIPAHDWPTLPFRSHVTSFMGSLLDHPIQSRPLVILTHRPVGSLPSIVSLKFLFSYLPVCAFPSSPWQNVLSVRAEPHLIFSTISPVLRTMCGTEQAPNPFLMMD